MNNDSDIIKKIEESIRNNNREQLDEAFNIIYNKYHKLVKFIAYRIVKNEEVVEDITQDTFINFFNNLTITKIRNIKYWLTTTARNLSLNYINSHAYKKVTYNDEVIYEFIHHYSSSDDIKEKLNELKKILTSEELEIIYLHLIFNYTFKEIANEKNVSINSISSKYSRAIKKFKKYFK